MEILSGDERGRKRGDMRNAGRGGLEGKIKNRTMDWADCGVDVRRVIAEE